MSTKLEKLKAACDASYADYLGALADAAYARSVAYAEAAVGGIPDRSAAAEAASAVYAAYDAYWAASDAVLAEIDKQEKSDDH